MGNDITPKSDGMAQDDFLATLHGAAGFGAPEETVPLAPRRAFHLSRRAKSIHEGLFSTALRGSVGFLPFALIGGGMMVTTPAQATPAGANIVSGGVTIQNTTAQRMDIVQTTSKAIIDWKSFNVGVDEHVNFDHQAGADSITLNRVTGGSASTIAGQLTALGNVWILNQNGVIFSSSARVDVGGLMATTSDIGNQDFLDGKYDFIDTGTDGSVINEGQINIKDGGLAAFVAPHVTNNGVITANLGKVALAAGHTFTVDLYGDGMIQLATSAENVPDTVSLEQSGEIYAAGGKVHLTAKAAGNLVDNIINMDGVIEATSASVGQNGQIIIHGGDNGIVAINGTLDASGKGVGETGGEVQVLGHKVGLFGNTTIDASGHSGGGEVYIGGDYQGGGTLDTAEFAYVGENVKIHADAIETGDGGKIIVWSDDTTRFHGGLSATGGALSGDGGFAEVSGKISLTYDGLADMTAINGELGMLLLDPTNISIAAAGANDADGALADNTLAFAEGGATFEISANQIETMLSTGNVILQASNDITVSDAISVTAPGNTLTLEAGNDIFVNQSIHIGSGNIVLDSGGTINLGAGLSTFQGFGAASGDITFDGNVELTSNVLLNTLGLAANAGDITFNGTLDGAFALDFSVISQGAANTITFAGDIGGTTALTALDFNNGAVGAVANADFQGNVSVGTFDMYLFGTGDVSFRGNVNVTDGFTIADASANVDVNLYGDITSTGDNITIDGNEIFLHNNIAIDTGAGAGNIIFNSTIDSDVGQKRNLTLTAGTGDIDFTGNVGATNALGTVQVVSATDVSGNNLDASNTATGSFNLDALHIDAVGTANVGAITVNTNSVAHEVDILAQNIILSGAVADGVLNGTASQFYAHNDITVNGAVDLSDEIDMRAGGSIAINADINIDGGGLSSYEAGDHGFAGYNAGLDVSANPTLSIAHGATVTTGNQTGFRIESGTGGMTINGTIVADHRTTLDGVANVTDLYLDDGAIISNNLLAIQYMNIFSDGDGVAEITNNVGNVRILYSQHVGNDGNDIVIDNQNSSGLLDMSYTVDGGVTVINNAFDGVSFYRNGFGGWNVADSFELDNVGDSIITAGRDNITSVNTTASGTNLLFHAAGNSALTGSAVLGGDLQYTSDANITLGTGAGAVIDATGSTDVVLVGADMNSNYTARGGTGNLTMGHAGAYIDLGGNSGLILHGGDGIGTDAQAINTRGATDVSILGNSGDINLHNTVSGDINITQQTISHTAASNGTVYSGTITGVELSAAGAGDNVQIRNDAGSITLTNDLTFTDGGTADGFVSLDAEFTAGGNDGDILDNGGTIVLGGAGLLLQAAGKIGHNDSGSNAGASSTQAIMIDGLTDFAAQTKHGGMMIHTTGAATDVVIGTVNGVAGLTKTAATQSHDGDQSNFRFIEKTGGSITVNEDITHNSNWRSVFLQGVGSQTDLTVNAGADINVAGTNATLSIDSFKDVLIDGTLTATSDVLLNSIYSSIDINNTVQSTGGGRIQLGASASAGSNKNLGIGTGASGNLIIDDTSLSNLSTNGGELVFGSFSVGGNQRGTISINTTFDFADDVQFSVSGNHGDFDIVVESDLTSTNAGVDFVFDTYDANTSASTIQLGGNITTNGGDIIFQNSSGATSPNIELLQNTTLSTGSGAGDVTFGGVLDSDAGQNRTLDITAGAGTIDFQGIVGGADALGAVNFQADEIDFGAAFTTAGNATLTTGTADTAINVGAGTGASLDLTDAELDRLNVGGALTVGDITNAGNISVDTYSGFDSDVNFLNAGAHTITIGGNLENTDAGSGINLNSGSGGIHLDANLTTNNGNITLSDAVEVGANAAINTGVGAGDVVFQGTVDSDAGQNRNLTIDSGAGTTDFQGIVGGTDALGNVSVAADEIEVGAAFTTAGNTILTVGTNDTAINVGAGTGAGLDITDAELDNLNIGGTLTIGDAVDAGNITIDAYSGFSGDTAFLNAGNHSLTIGATLTNTSAGGSLSFGSGSGGTHLDADVTTNNGTMTFQGNVELGTDIALSTGLGAGNIDFQGTVDGDIVGRNLTLTAGTGDIFFKGNVGIGSALGTLLVNQTDDFLIQNNSQMHVDTFNQAIMGTGTTGFGDGGDGANGLYGLTADSSLIAQSAVITGDILSAAASTQLAKTASINLTGSLTGTALTGQSVADLLFPQLLGAGAQDTITSFFNGFYIGDNYVPPTSGPSLAEIEQQTSRSNLANKLQSVINYTQIAADRATVGTVSQGGPVSNPQDPASAAFKQRKEGVGEVTTNEAYDAGKDVIEDLTNVSATEHLNGVNENDLIGMNVIGDLPMYVEKDDDELERVYEAGNDGEGSEEGKETVVAKLSEKEEV